MILVNTSPRRFLVAAGVVAAVATVVMLVKQFSPRFLPPLSSPSSLIARNAQTPLKSSPALRIVPTLMTAGGKTVLAISLRPEKNAVSLYAFSLKLTLTPSAGEMLKAGKLAPHANAIASGWTFPIAAIQKESSGAIVVKLSRTHIAKSPAILAKNTVMVSLPLESPESPLTASLDESVTEFFGLEGASIPFILDRHTLLLK